MVSHQENINKVWAKSFSYLQKLRKETAADGVIDRDPDTVEDGD